MTTDRRGPVQSVRRADGRYVRWSWRYNTFQVKTKDNQWRNISVHMARAYVAAGLPMGVK